MKESGLVKLATYDKKKDAEFVKSVLLENGIESVLKGEDLYGISESNIGNYYLYVLEDDLKAAQMVIKAITDPSAEIDLPEKEIVEKERKIGGISTTSIYSAVVFLLIGFLIGFGFSDKIKNSLPKQDSRKDYDLNGDGIADRWDYYVEEILVQQTFDRNFDGRIDEWLTYKNGFDYDLLQKDTDFNGTPDTFYHFKNNAFSKCEMDLDENKSPDLVGYYKNGIFEKAEVFDKASGKLRAVVECTKGLRSREFLDTDGDGVFDKSITYDEYGIFKEEEKIK